ncbi:MAG: hypothetical protein E5Y63_02125 [Mesorhizobium sp.]|nr:MAG: hypothetical protein E5Y63_02125 [Mesorhizobium sp.]
MLRPATIQARSRFAGSGKDHRPCKPMVAGRILPVAREKKPVSPAVAARLGKMFGDGAAIWFRMQAAYDAWHAEREVDVSAIPTLHAA